MHEQLLHANAIASNSKGKYIAHKSIFGNWNFSYFCLNPPIFHVRN